MRIEGLAQSYEVSEPRVEEVPVTDHFFRARMARDGIELQEDETVTDYVLRAGFPYSIHEPGERNDN